MHDWMDQLGETIVRFGLWLAEGRSLKRAVGIVFACLSVFVFVMLIAVAWFGWPGDARHLFWLVPTEIIFVAIAGYCLLTSDA